MTRERHPTTRTWTFPEREALVDVLPGGTPGNPIERTNLKELAARPDRLEHHLVIVARLGCAQLELATASEPLYFAHINISDEYALPLPTGDPLLDAFPMRTFVSDATTGADIGRYNHKSGDLVLHPVGHAHWPGKLRPPYEGMAIPPGMRRCGVSVVYCASVPTLSTAPQLPPPAKPDDVKAYASPPPALGLASTIGSFDRLAPLAPPALAAPGIDTGVVIARVGDTELALVDNPMEIAPPHGGWVIVLATRAQLVMTPQLQNAIRLLQLSAEELAELVQEERLGNPILDDELDLKTGNSPADGVLTFGAPAGSAASATSVVGSSFAVGDLLRLPAGARLPGGGIARCLVLRGSAEPEAIPPTWSQLPAIPFAVFEDAERGALPFVHDGLRIEERSPSTVAVLVEDAVAEVPRHWLARMLYRIALHDIRLNYVETYGGLFVDDSQPDVQIGLRIEGRKVSIAIPRREALGVIERLYRAIAPPDYRERIA